MNGITVKTLTEVKNVQVNRALLQPSCKLDVAHPEEDRHCSGLGQGRTGVKHAFLPGINKLQCVAGSTM